MRFALAHKSETVHAVMLNIVRLHAAGLSAPRPSHGQLQRYRRGHGASCSDIDICGSGYGCARCGVHARNCTLSTMQHEPDLSSAEAALRRSHAQAVVIFIRS